MDYQPNVRDLKLAMLELESIGIPQRTYHQHKPIETKANREGL